MSKAITVSRVVFTGCITVLAAFSAQAADKVGVVGVVNPDTKVTGADGAIRAVKAGDDIYLNDTIVTTGKGSAQLMFLDRSALTVSPDTSVKIDTFVYNPATEDGTMSLQSAKGAFRFIGGALTKKKPVNIKTPVSTIGIRGGIVDAFVNANGKPGGDAVLLFGKELTLTDASGHTLSTTQFGTGLGVGQNGVAVTLPKDIVMQHIQNSPTNAAANNAPVVPTGGALQQKIHINTTGSGGDNGASNDSGNGSGGSGGGGAANGAANNGDSGSGTASSDGGSNAGDATLSDDTTGNGVTETAVGTDSRAVSISTDALLAPGAIENPAALNVGIPQSVQAIAQTTTSSISQVSPSEKPNQKPSNTTKNPNDDTNGGTTNNPPTGPVTGNPDIVTTPPTNTANGGTNNGNGTTTPPPSWRPNPAIQPVYVGAYEYKEDDLTTSTTVKREGGRFIVDNTGNRAGFGLHAGSYLGITEQVTPNTVSPDQEHALALPNNFSSNMIYNLAAGSIVAQDASGTFSDFYGQAYRNSAGTFNYYRLNEYTPSVELDDLNLVFGTPFFQNSNVTTALLETRLREAGQDAAGAVLNQGIVEYDFLSDMLPDVSANANMFDYNALNLAGIVGSSFYTGPFASPYANRGLLVDWDSRKFLTSYVDFTGEMYGGATMVTAFGDIVPNPAAVGTAVSNGHLINGNLFSGKMFYDFTGDTNSDGITDTGELYGSNGSTRVNPGLVFGNDTAAQNDHIDGFVFEAETSSGSKYSQPVIQRATQGTFAPMNTARVYDGFTAGMMYDDQGNMTRIKSGLGGMNVVLEANQSVGGTMLIQKVDGTAGPLQTLLATPPTINFGTATGSSSAAIQGNMYAAEINQNIMAGVAKGVVVTGSSNGTPLCTACQYTHWGVWGVTHQTAVPGQGSFTGLVPYVAGEVFSGDIQAANGVSGTVNYAGESAGNFMVHSNTTNTDNVVNAVGTMAAAVNLSTRSIPSTGLEVNFPSVVGNTVNVRNASPINLPAGGINSFTTPTVTASINGTPTTNGSMNGALFGPQGREIGGNFNVKGTSTQSNISGGGIFIGHCTSGPNGC